MVATSAQAQSYQCRAPSVLRSVPSVQKPANQPRRVKTVDGYTLAMSWSPEFCRSRKDDKRHKTQCSGDDGSFGFILHGLWPDSRGSYPQWCGATRALPAALVKRNFCAMPSPRLMANEWAKHGTCMAKRPETYFRISRVMFGAMDFPNMDALSRKPLTAGALREAFVAANEGLRPEMIRLKINRRGWLQDVRLCLGQNFRPRRCPANMRPEKAETPVKIWRGA